MTLKLLHIIILLINAGKVIQDIMMLWLRQGCSQDHQEQICRKESFWVKLPIRVLN
jgi:hypothetical protein